MRFLKHFLKPSTIMALIVAMLSITLADDWAVDKGSAYTKRSKSLSLGLSAIPIGLSVAYDYGFHPAISGGGATGGILSPDVYVPVIARAAFHPFNLKAWKVDRALREKLDIFGGLASGFELGANAPFPFIIREYIGARFYFAPKFAAFLEDCAGFLNMGLTIKM
jgi:hypothetical protein